MGNCLKTQLKESVNNNELLHLNGIEMNLKSSTFYGFNYVSGFSGHVRSINNNSIPRTEVQSFSMNTFSNIPADTVVEVERADMIHSVAIKDIVFDAEQLRISPLTYLLISSTSFSTRNYITGELIKILKNSYNTIAELYISTTSNITGDIGELLDTCGTQLTTLTFIASTNIGGTLDSLLPLTLASNLSLNVRGTAITSTQSALDTLRSRGYTITIDESQIIG